MNRDDIVYAIQNRFLLEAFYMSPERFLIDFGRAGASCFVSFFDYMCKDYGENPFSEDDLEVKTYKANGSYVLELTYKEIAKSVHPYNTKNYFIFNEEMQKALVFSIEKAGTAEIIKLRNIFGKDSQEYKDSFDCVFICAVGPKNRLNLANVPENSDFLPFIMTAFEEILIN